MAPGAQSLIGLPPVDTPHHLAQKILSSKATLEGERKQVTVLFADLKSSTELLADRDPEEARELLHPVLDHMMEAVHHYEGTVNQTAGDGIMALFGAPLAHEDHAVRACFAALRMQERVKRHAEGIFNAQGVNLQIRVGLNSGEVVVGTIRSDLRMDYTAVGRTTHLAARMEQLASPGSILLTPSTLRLAEGLVVARSLGPVPVKGLAEPLEVHELTGTGPARTRFQAAVRRRLTPFVGRDSELEQLRRMQGLARDGHGQVAALVAEAGAGKSRLVYELTHSLGREGWLVLECGAVSYGTAMSWLPVVGLLRGYFKIENGDDLQAIETKVTARLLALDRALEPGLPALLALLDVPVTDEAWQTLDPSERRRRTLDTVRRLLIAAAGQQPCVVIFEDLHWIDGETQALLDDLVDSLASARLLLLVTCRPEYRHAWSGKPPYHEMRLDALSTERGGKLLDALLGDDPAIDPLKQRLASLGNPFFLEEAVRTLVETRALDGVPGRYRLIQPIPATQVPATVQATLAARIDRLPAAEKHLLQVASVVGMDVPISVLQAVAELPDTVLWRRLAYLQGAEFIHESRPPPAPECSFKHSLTHEVAYGSLLHERRRELHARIVEAIETLHRDGLDQHVERLAHHSLRGELRERAVSYLFRAGRKAQRQSAPLSAVGCYDQALLLLEALPESQFKLERNLDIRIRLRGVLIGLGETRKAIQRLSEVEAVADKLDDERRRARFWVALATLKCLRGDLDEALGNAKHALAIAERLEDPTLCIQSRIVTEQIQFYRGDYRQVVELASIILAAEPHDELFHYSANYRGPTIAHHYLTLSLIQLGRFSEAASHVKDLFRLAGPTHGRATGLAQSSEAIRLLAMGDWAHARPYIEQSIEAYRRSNNFLTLTHAVAMSALSFAQLDETSEAIRRVQEGESLLEQQTADGTIAQYGMDYIRLGRAVLRMDRLDDAKRFASCAIQLTPSHPGSAAHAQNLLGDLAMHRDCFDAEKSEIHFRNALALAEPRCMRPLIAHCNFGLGKIYRRLGNKEHADEHLETAMTLYREMGMAFWLKQVEAGKR
ncbi:MAG: adenylate/guanylate cyclase domain-containing protein [Reyranellaceae bacterium]